MCVGYEIVCLSQSSGYRVAYLNSVAAHRAVSTDECMTHHRRRHRRCRRCLRRSPMQLLYFMFFVSVLFQIHNAS